MLTLAEEYSDIIKDYNKKFPDLNFTNLSKLIISEQNVRTTPESFRKAVSKVLGDFDIVVENVRLSKQKQKFQDINRIERKSFREDARRENALEELAIAIKKELKENAKELGKINIKPLVKEKEGAIGIIHISDPHGNELINLPHNKFDFSILAQRMKYYINSACDYFKFMNVTKVLFACTGDLLNSDRRLDEILNSATNRAKASILMLHLIKQAILDVRDKGFSVEVISVLGNEARIGQELPYSEQALSENYDFLIMANLKELFEFVSIKGINFLSVDKVEEIVNVNGQNWLISHDISKYTEKQNNSQSAIGRYSLQGKKIDYIIGGHVHATRITDYTSRASSFSGSNSFNENSLNLAGRASGTYYVVKNNKRFVCNIDLQNVDGVEGYCIVDKLKAYHAKSTEKLQTKQIIHQIVV
jgi:hypothetical protein